MNPLHCVETIRTLLSIGIEHAIRMPATTDVLNHKNVSPLSVIRPAWGIPKEKTLAIWRAFEHRGPRSWQRRAVRSGHIEIGCQLDAVPHWHHDIVHDDDPIRRSAFVITGERSRQKGKQKGKQDHGCRDEYLHRSRNRPLLSTHFALPIRASRTSMLIVLDCTFWLLGNSNAYCPA